MNSGYFFPVDGGGFVSFVQGGEGPGWYQLDTPGAVVDTLPLVVPDYAQGILVQAITDLHWCGSPSAAADGATGSFLLAAGNYVQLPGRTWLKNFCVLLGASGASFRIQFLKGAIGPMPWITGTSTGGVTPPPPPGLSAVFTTNTVHVMKAPYGNDATGTRNRLDLPFETVSNGMAELQTGDTLVIWAGYYEEGDLNPPVDCTIFRMGADLVAPDGSASLFTIDGVTVHLAGWGRLDSEDSTGTASVITAAGVGTRLWIQGDVNCSGLAEGVQCFNGAYVEHRGNVTALNLAVRCQNVDTADVTRYRAYGDIRSTEYIGARNEGAADTEIWGNVRGYQSAGALNVGTRQVIHGDATVDINGQAAESTVGLQEIDGSAIGLGEDAIGALCSGGRQFIGRNAASQDTLGAKADFSGVQVIGGDATSVNDYGAMVENGGTMTLGGRAISNSLEGAVVYEGTMTLVGGAEQTSGSAAVILMLATSELILKGGAFLTTIGGAGTVDDDSGGTASVRSYGAYGSAAMAGTLTVQGTFNVLP